jgi:hypothetical protein
VQATRPEKGVALGQDLLCPLIFGLALAQAARATTTIMWQLMIASKAHSPSTGICTPMMTMTDITITRTRTILYLPPSLLQQQRKVSAPINRELHQQRIHVLDFLTDSHIKLDILVDTQEPFKDSHHKVALDYDEDTMSLVEHPILSTFDISLSNNSNSSAGNASTAFEYKCYEIEADAP